MITSRLLRTLSAVMCASFLLANQVHAKSLKDERVTDGPYIDVHNKALTVNWICDDQVKHSQLTLEGDSLPYSFNACGLTATTSQLHFDEQLIEYQNVKRVAALSDLHGQYELMLTLLKNNKIIDKNNRWAFADGHFVITGDIFDRGDTVTEALWLIYKLEQQALAAGGKLHYLLGNHEYMVLRDDQRYLHPKYVHAVSHFNNDLRQQYSNNSVLGRWLRSKSTIININGFIFLHGGIHQDFLDLKLSLEQANSEFRKTIGLGKKALKENPAWLTLHGSNGPIWYRGYFRDDALNDTQVDAVLSQLNGKKVIVGHTSMPTIETRFNSKIIAIDSSIKRGEKGEILLWQNGEFKRGLMSGEQKPLQ